MSNAGPKIMREDNLLCFRKRKFAVTTDSSHSRKVYPNLAGRMVLTGMDQLWIADITYIRPRDEFVYVGVILDALLTPGDRLGAGQDHGG
jgi:putative transposase